MTGRAGFFLVCKWNWRYRSFFPAGAEFDRGVTTDMGGVSDNGFLKDVRRRFASHVAGFDPITPAHRFHYDLKRVHSHKVAKAMVEIGRAIGLEAEDLVLAEAIGLLHDIGRFTQFARYGTFKDSLSVDHGALGAEILSGNGWLSALNRHDRDLIDTAVRYHNKAALPELPDARTDRLARLIRDADKLDIFRVLEETFHQPDWPGIFGLPVGDEISTGVLDASVGCRVVDAEHLENHIDFIFMRIGWFYDINYAPTLHCVVQRGYDATMRAHLPDTEKVRTALAAVDEFMGKVLKRQPS